MKLIEKQRLFVQGLSLLFQFAHFKGYELRLGEGYIGDSVKPSESRLHRPNGLHFNRCAIDLMLDVNGKWISDGDHPAWMVLGIFWGYLHPDFRWGGRFGLKDSNHFSIEHGGKA